jgi:Zn-dependent protease with chaperone function
MNSRERRASPPRLDPFVFPSSTVSRFALLILTVLGASLFLFNVMAYSFPGHTSNTLQTYAECRTLAPTPDLLPGSATQAPTAYTAASEAFTACVASVGRITAALTLGGVAALLGVAGAIYWLYPGWKIRREGLEPLEPEDAPELVAYLDDLSHEAGLSRAPTFLLNPLAPSNSGLAFGRFGRYYVVLNGGLAVQFYVDRPAFRAVMLHELAHLRNGDVNKTYFTVAVWWAFLGVALIPFFVSMLLEWDASLAFGVGWRALVLAGLVYLTRNAVLRAREVYADVRASVGEGPDGALDRVLQSLARPKPARWREAIPERWRRALDVHPDPDERRGALRETSGLFEMGGWEAFATGLSVSVAFPQVHSLLSLLAGTNAQLSLTSLALGFIFAPLIVGVAGLGAWRTTFVALIRGEAPRCAARLGLALGAGVVVGQALSFDAAAGTLGRSVSSGSGLFSGFGALWAVLLLVGLYLFLLWVAAGASQWLAVATTGRSVRRTCALGLFVASVVLAIWIGPFFWLSALGETAGPALFVTATLYAFLHPLTLLPLIILWAFPLSACLLRERTSLEAGWAFLDSSPLPSAPAAKVACRPGLAVTAGLAVGLAFCALLLAARLWLHASVPEATRDTNQYRMVFFGAQVAAAALMQAGVAAVVAGRVRRLGSLHGLCAAFVAGCAMTAGLLGLNVVFGGTSPPAFAFMVFKFVISGGALLALPVSLAVAVLASRIRRSRRPDDGRGRNDTSGGLFGDAVARELARNR